MARRDENETIQKLFSVLHLFRANTVISYEQLATLLHESESDARRDMELFGSYEINHEILHFLFLEPEELAPSGGVYIMDDLSVLERPLRLNASQIEALLAALDYAQAAPSGALMNKLSEALESTRATQSVRLYGGHANPHVLEDLALFVEKHHLAYLDYCKTGESSSTRRLVEPMRLYLARGEWYLDAWCHTSQGVRTFKLDRIVATEDATRHFAPRHDELRDARSFLNEGADNPLASAPCALLRMSLAEPFALEDWPGSEVLREEEGLRYVSVPYLGLNWIARQIVARLGRIEILEPPELVQAARDIARATLALQETCGIRDS